MLNRVFSFRGCALLVLTLLFGEVTAFAQSQKDRYLQYVLEAAEREWERYPQVIEEWRRDVSPYVLWGYNAPAQPVYLAYVLGFLYEETGDETYARRAAQILSEFGDLRDTYPADFAETRIEYADGIPALANFFFLPPYSGSYTRIRNSGVLDDAMRVKIERDLAHSLDFVFHFPEWGAHNRAMLRAEGLYYGYLAIPDHPNAPKWRQMAEATARDNLEAWQIEDATIYHPVWLNSIFSYTELTDRADLLRSPFMHFYAEYFKRMFAPADVIPTIGDADYNPMWEYYVASYEKLASLFQDPELRWIARRIYDKMEAEYPERTAWSATNMARAFRWADDTLEPRQPTTGSQEVVEDIVGKKIVFRNGWDPTSTYLLLNYRDEGDGGFRDREFLRNTISVEEEKMHHGQSDENAVSMLMDGGSMLLHDSGYRDGLPSGEYGGYRADYYQNRIVVRKDKRDVHQTLPEFIRNSGAYRPVRTQKIEFLTLQDVDMSRTRLIDDNLGYTWDRIITYLKEPGFFVVVDAVRADITDFFTFTNIWHAQNIHQNGRHFYVTSYDSLAGRGGGRTAYFPDDRRLLIQFLDNDAKTDSFYVQDRHYQDERAVYQTISSHYRPGDYEVFVTALIPHDNGAQVEPLLDKIRLMPVDGYPQAVGLEIEQEGRTSWIGIKLDLESGVVRENIRPRYTWEAGRTTYGDFETDAHFFFATRSGNELRYAASEVLKMIHNGNVLMEALPNTHPLQLDGAPDRVGFVKWRQWEDTVNIRP